MSYNNQRQNWENTPLFQLKISFLAAMADNIFSRWDDVSSYMDIDSNKEVMAYTDSKIPNELSYKMLEVAAERGKTVRDLNYALKNTHFNGYVISALDVNNNRKE